MLRWQPRNHGPSGSKSARLYGKISAIAIGALSLSGHPGTPALVYNPSPSAPLGYYRTLPARPLMRGDWVLVRAPKAARQLADQRGYLSASVPMIKTVVALAGDRICASGSLIYVNGAMIAARLHVDHHGRPLPWWTGCRTLGANDVFVINRFSPSSFDGRYFGVVSREAVLARLVHL
ncbi:hypothetical protein MMA231_03659 (plasmid) [Asticcacaulis sp. MM231]|uniref:S26 family signal peptidase n=1 Tax=Asticcacaulis sp. MM231 TaxID=3157666 RepID=UPI0032D56C65